MSDHLHPPRKQSTRPERAQDMRPKPDYSPRFPGAGRLTGKVALITGGDGGIGRAVAVAMAREGADIAIVYLNDHRDAEETVRLVETEDRNAIHIAGDVGQDAICRNAVNEVVKTFGRLDILVNAAAEPHEVVDFTALSAERLEEAFRTNVFGCFFMTRAALQHLPRGGAIINTTSIMQYRGAACEGYPTMTDDAATRGAVVAFTRSLSTLLIERGIRVNAVAPGPVQTPLTQPDAEQAGCAPMGRPGQPNEVAACHVFLASDDASYMTGQVLHPNGGGIVAL